MEYHWLAIFGILGVLSVILTIASFTIPDQLTKEYIQKITIILIPIVAGGIATKFTTNSWQITKEKLSIKRKILSDYEESYKKISMLLENFLYQVIESYIVYEKDTTSILFEDFSNDAFQITTYLKFPSNIDDKPDKKFNWEYTVLSEKLRETSFIQNRFVSSIRLYYQDDALDKTRLEIEKTLKNEQDLLQKFIHSNNANEMISTYKQFQEQSEIVITQMKSLETYMVGLAFREINL